MTKEEALKQVTAGLVSAFNKVVATANNQNYLSDQRKYLNLSYEIADQIAAVGKRSLAS